MKSATKYSTPGEILTAALAKERAAYRFYEKLENSSRSMDFVYELVIKLKDEEAKHIRMVEEQITLMNLGRL
jgi:rubrerythrin